MGHLVGAISIDDLVLVAQNVRASADAASVVGFHAVGRVERRGRGVGSLSRFRDGVDHLFVAALVASGVRRAACGDRPYDDPVYLAAPVHLARVGTEPEPGSGQARFVGEPARGEQRHGQTDRFAVLCRRAVTASRRRPAGRGTTAH